MPSEAFRLIIQGISTGEQTQNVLHFIVDNNDDATPLELASELVDIFHDDLKSDWLAFQSNRYAIRWIEAKRVLPGGGNSVWKEYPEGTEVGIIDAEQGVLQLAPIIKIFGGISSNVQGRCFLPPPAETSCEANVLDTSYVDNAIDVFEEMLSLSSAHDWSLAIYSRKTGTAVPATTVAMSGILGMQGRRRRPL